MLDAFIREMRAGKPGRFCGRAAILHVLAVSLRMMNAVNVVLWILQVLLALHTAMGAVWKFSNSEQTVPSLQAIPHGAWLA